MLCCSVGQCAVYMLFCCPKPPEHMPADEYEWVRPAHCQHITRSSSPPPSKGTSLNTVTQCYPRQPGKRLWRSNQLWLNTECDGFHYSKSRTAKALMTIDYLNIACIRCGGFHAHLSCICLRRGSGLSSTCLLILPFIYDDRDYISDKMPHCTGISQFSLPYSFSRVAIFDIVQMDYQMLVFHEVA